VQDVESQNKRNLGLGGTRIAECAETAVARLSGSGDPRLALKKYTFKWGNKPVMELTLDSGKNRMRLGVCFVLWIFLTLYMLQPLIRPSKKLA
jgi:hypothetical protein